MMQQPFSDDHLRWPVPRVIETNDRLHQLFNKPAPLTREEWAELLQAERDAEHV